MTEATSSSVVTECMESSLKRLEISRNGSRKRRKEYCSDAGIDMEAKESDSKEEEEEKIWDVGMSTRLLWKQGPSPKKRARAFPPSPSKVLSMHCRNFSRTCRSRGESKDDIVETKLVVDIPTKMLRESPSSQSRVVA